MGLFPRAKLESIFPSNKVVDEAIEEQDSSDLSSEEFAKPLDKGYKDLGIVSATGLMINRMLGTGIFATPATIYTLCGNSVGLSLIIWFVGSLIAFTGLLVYMEFGSNIHRNGGEKNYLEYVYKKPKFLITCVYGIYALALPWAAGNAVFAGTLLMEASGAEATKWGEKGIGLAVITFAFLINSIHIKTGAYLQNILGIFKLGIVLFIAVTGWVALGGWKKTDNFSNTFSTANTATAYGVVNALYNVIWSFVGYSNANYALGEVKNPVRTLKIAGPAAFISLATIYMFVNIAFFAVVPQNVLENSSQLLVADFFDIAFGETAKKAATVFVALSAIGNVMSVIFSQGRIVNQLGREGVLPFSNFFATSKPFNSPMVGLGEHWFVVVIFIVSSENGDAYNLVVNLISYPLNIINLFVGIALIYLNIQNTRGKLIWKPQLRATIPVAVFFCLSNVYLIVAPYIPPDEGQSVYNHLPYYIHCVIAWGIFALGGIYWYLWSNVVPKVFHYTLHAEEVIGEDGFWRNKFTFIKNDEYKNYVVERASTTNSELPPSIEKSQGQASDVIQN
jgi:amino acid transporter